MYSDVHNKVMYTTSQQNFQRIRAIIWKQGKNSRKRNQLQGCFQFQFVQKSQQNRTKTHINFQWKPLQERNNP